MRRLSRTLALPLCLALVAAAGCTGDDDKEGSKDTGAAPTTVDIKVGAIFDYVKGWYTMATMVEGIAKALKKVKAEKLDGEAIKAGLEEVTGFTTGVSDPIGFSATSHAGMQSASLHQVENGTFRKIA